MIIIRLDQKTPFGTWRWTSVVQFAVAYPTGSVCFDGFSDRHELLRSIQENTELSIRPIKVMYQNIPKTIKVAEYIKTKHMLNKNEDDYIQTVTNTIATKSESWKYENEMRIISLNEHNAHRYSPLALKEIIIGFKMPEDQRKLVISAAKLVNSSVSIKEAKLAKNSYRIKISTITTAG